MAGRTDMGKRHYLCLQAIVEANRPLQPSAGGAAVLPYATLSVGCICLGRSGRPCPRTSIRDSRHAAYLATQPHRVGFGATLLTFLPEAKVPGGRVHG